MAKDFPLDEPRIGHDKLWSLPDRNLDQWCLFSPFSIGDSAWYIHCLGYHAFIESFWICTSRMASSFVLWSGPLHLRAWLSLANHLIISATKDLKHVFIGTMPLTGMAAPLMRRSRMSRVPMPTNTRGRAGVGKSPRLWPVPITLGNRHELEHKSYQGNDQTAISTKKFRSQHSIVSEKLSSLGCALA